MQNQKDDHQLLDLYKQMEDISYCMLTTRGVDGSLHSRPMATQQVEITGRIWFFTCDRTLKVSEITASPEVNLSFINDDGKTFISVSGKALIVNDKDRMHDLWDDSLRAWFPEGLAEPGLSLVEVDAEDIAYWITEENKLKKAFQFARAFVTGEDEEEENSGNIHLEN